MLIGRNYNTLAKSRRPHNKGLVLRHYIGHSRYEHSSDRVIGRYQTVIALSSFVILSLLIMQLRPERVVVKAKTEVVTQEKTVVIDKNENVDTWIGEAVNEFLPTHSSEARMIMHCLAHRENGHGSNPDAHGDGGLAGGPFQFHEDTWVRMRKEMMKDGHAQDIGSRYDFKESARTTAYAIQKGWAREWGPILRDSKGNTFASCQTPSWYRK